MHIDRKKKDLREQRPNKFLDLFTVRAKKKNKYKLISFFAVGKQL